MSWPLVKPAQIFTTDILVLELEASSSKNFPCKSVNALTIAKRQMNKHTGEWTKHSTNHNEIKNAVK